MGGGTYDRVRALTRARLLQVVMKCEVPVVPPVLGNQGEATIPEVADTKVKARDAKKAAF